MGVDIHNSFLWSSYQMWNISSHTNTWNVSGGRGKGGERGKGGGGGVKHYNLERKCKSCILHFHLNCDWLSIHPRPPAAIVRNRRDLLPKLPRNFNHLQTVAYPLILRDFTVAIFLFNNFLPRALNFTTSKASWAVSLVSVVFNEKTFIPPLSQSY